MVVLAIDIAGFGWCNPLCCLIWICFVFDTLFGRILTPIAGGLVL